MRHLFLVASSLDYYGRQNGLVTYLFRNMFNSVGLPLPLVIGSLFLQRAMTKTDKSSNSVPGNTITVAPPSEAFMWIHALSIVEDPSTRKKCQLPETAIQESSGFRCSECLPCLLHTHRGGLNIKVRV